MSALREIDIKFGPDAITDGLKPQAIRAVVVAAAVFTRLGFDCWVTSAVRPDDTDSLHCYGMAVDFDSSGIVSFDAFKVLAEDIQAMLGDNYDVIYHKGHVHAEYDPGGQGVAPYVNGI
jgi:hypothetical protein